MSFAQTSSRGRFSGTSTGRPVSRSISFAQLTSDEGLGRYQRPGLAIEHVEEAVAVGLEPDRRLLPVDVEIGEHQFVHPVIVPGVVGRRLVVPDDLAGIRVERQRAGRVEVGELAVIARIRAALRRSPRRSVTGPVIDEIELRVVGANEPCGTTAIFPQVVLPGFRGGARRRQGPYRYATPACRYPGRRP